MGKKKFNPTMAAIRNEADERAVSRGHYFDPEAADKPVLFFEKHLRHTIGEWAGQPFILQPWQRDDIIRPLLGWKRADGTRRYRVAYIEVPKKNGKSMLCSGLTLYGLTADNEPGAQVYGAASDKLQAGIVYREAAAMVRASVALSKRLKVVDSTRTLIAAATNSFYRVLSSDAFRNEGINVHWLVFDELHAQPDRRLWDALRYGGASRRQPLTLAITTSGFDKHSVCWEQHDYADKIIGGVIEDDSFFAFIRAADRLPCGQINTDYKPLDWTKPLTWYAANPSLGVTMKEADFAADCKEAENSPTKENSFKRYRLNIWTEQEVRWLQMDKWQACGGVIDETALEGRRCYGGLDLASKVDLAAWALVFPPLDDADKWVILPRCYIPKNNALEKELRDKVPYTTWERQGFITLTDGDAIDYDFIEAKILEDAKCFEIAAAGYDPYGASQLVQHLIQAGINMVEFRQGMLTMSEPTKEFERLVILGKINHGNHPVLRWCASNVVTRSDPAGNIMADKGKCREKIDPIVASIMGLGMAISSAEDGKSVYETGEGMAL